MIKYTVLMALEEVRMYPFYRRKNKLTMETENAGIAIRNVSTIKDRSKQVYVSLTGNQCVVTNVRVLL